MNAPGLHVVQLSDLHLFASPELVWKNCNTSESFHAVVQRVKALIPQPDVLILTGDLSQDETPESYGHLHAAIAPLQIPTYWIPGNHDHVEIASQVLIGTPFSSDRTFEQKGWRFILLNSAVPGHVEGGLEPAELDWLSSQLTQHADQPTIIAVHHHPVPIQSPWMDAIGLHHPEAFLALVDAHPQVHGVIFGHIHHAIECDRNGVRYLGCPSTCIQVVPQQADMVLDTRPPGLRRLMFYADGTWETEVLRIT
jgi:3',5'-cyclic-AMP phosphodiesterase